MIGFRNSSQMKLLNIILIPLLSVSCYEVSCQDEVKELVMQEGEKLSFKDQRGTLIVEATSKLGRSFTWDGVTREIELIPRSTRWHEIEVLGGYFPGPGNHWKEHDGISRAVVEEGQIRFDSEKDLQTWIKSEDWNYLKIKYNSSGLAVGWFKNYPRKQLDVVVFQVFVKGKIPANLKHSVEDQDLRLISGK